MNPNTRNWVIIAVFVGLIALLIKFRGKFPKLDMWLHDKWGWDCQSDECNKKFSKKDGSTPPVGPGSTPGGAQPEEESDGGTKPKPEIGGHIESHTDFGKVWVPDQDGNKPPASAGLNISDGYYERNTHGRYFFVNKSGRHAIDFISPSPYNKIPLYSELDSSGHKNLHLWTKDTYITIPNERGDITYSYPKWKRISTTSVLKTLDWLEYSGQDKTIEVKIPHTKKYTTQNTPSFLDPSLPLKVYPLPGTPIPKSNDADNIIFSQLTSIGATPKSDFNRWRTNNINTYLKYKNRILGSFTKSDHPVSYGQKGDSRKAISGPYHWAVRLFLLDPFYKIMPQINADSFSDPGWFTETYNEDVRKFIITQRDSINQAFINYWGLSYDEVCATLWHIYPLILWRLTLLFDRNLDIGFRAKILLTYPTYYPGSFNKELSINITG